MSTPTLHATESHAPPHRPTGRLALLVIVSVLFAVAWRADGLQNPSPTLTQTKRSSPTLIEKPRLSLAIGCLQPVNHDVTCAHRVGNRLGDSAVRTTPPLLFGAGAAYLTGSLASQSAANEPLTRSAIGATETVR